MIKYYFLTAWRSLNKNRFYAAIHLMGLVLSLTTCLLLIAYIANDFSYDRFHSKGDRIFRVNTDLVLPDQKVMLSLTSGLVGPSLRNDFSSVQNFTRVSQPWSDLSFKQGGQAHFEKNIFYVDSSFFSLFDFILLNGNPQTALREPNQIVLTERLAKKYFGNQNPIDQSITIDNQAYTVTGVAANPSGHSHLDFDALISYATWIQQFPYTETNWTWNPATTYILLNNASNASAIFNQLPKYIDAKLTKAQKSDEKIALSLEPFESIHFNEPRLGEFKAKSNKKQLFLLGLMGVFILAIALFNYVNLATAVYNNRTKEIGVRKTFGASQRQISLQFLSESILLCSIAVLVALLLSHSLLPLFSNQVNKVLDFNFLSPIVIGGALLSTALIIGPLAGFYPSFIVSRLQVARIFQNRSQTTGIGKFTLRRILIGLQFSISIGLILSTLVVWRQHQFLTNQNLGFAQDHKLVVKIGALDHLAISSEAIKQTLLQLPDIQGITFSSHIPSENPHGVGTVVTKEDGTEAQGEMELNLVDYDFLKLYGLKIIAGRDFDKTFSDSAAALIVNETAAKQLGFANSQDIIGRNFQQWEGKGKVIGVVQDFNQHSLHTKISPVTFQVNPSRFEKMTIQYQTTNVPALIGKLEQTWHSLVGTIPFDYSFLDERLELQYDAEQRFGYLFIAFTFMAIFIACIGLYGLTAITVRQRTKEIGIRKVLGANISSIVTLLSKEFLYLVLAASILAFPVVWWAMHNWLADFAYRINIQWWMFALSGAAALAIALLTVSLQAIRAAVANPVESLKNE